MQYLKWLGILTLLFCLIQPPATAEQWALLIGINDYVHPEIRDLKGCETDVKLMANVLMEHFGFPSDHLKRLLSREATREAILAAFKEWLIDKPKPGDTVVFYFSGHGSQVVDESGDEADGWDEILCPADVIPTVDRQQYLNPILDDELGVLLNQIPTVNVTVFLDSCHSGTGTKSLIDAGLTIPKRIERDLLLVPQKPAPPPTAQRDSIAVEPTNEHHVLISGSKPEEVSLDARWESPTGDAFYAGVLTKNLVEGLRRATAETRYKDLMAEMLPSVRERSPQTPQFEGDMERPIFASRQPDGTWTGVVVPVKPFALVTAVEGNRVTLNAGAIRGVTKGSMYDLFSPTEASFTGNPLAQMRITAVRPDDSAGEIMASHFTIQPMCRAVESSHAYPPDKLYLQLQMEGDVTPTSAGLRVEFIETSKSALTDALSKLPDVMVVDAGKYADVVLTVQIQGASLSGRLTSGDGTVGGEVTASNAAELAEKLRPTLENTFVLKQLLHFKNPNPPFKIEVWMDKGKDPVYQIGEVATFGFKSERNCYLTVLNVDTQGSVRMLFPNTYHPSNEIVANVSYTIPTPEMHFRIRAKGPAGKQLLKVIATTVPINLPELSLSRIHAPEEIFLAVGGSGEVRNLTKGLGRAFAVEAAESEPGEIAHIPTSAVVTSELIAKIVP